MTKRGHATYYYKNNGLQYQLMSSSVHNPKRLYSSCAVTPNFIRLMKKLENAEFDPDLWKKLSQMERNFLYNLNSKTIKNDALEMQHLEEATNSMNRLKLLEGSLAAGNCSKELLEEMRTLVNDLYSRHQMSTSMRTMLKKN